MDLSLARFALDFGKPAPASGLGLSLRKAREGVFDVRAQLRLLIVVQVG